MIVVVGLWQLIVWLYEAKEKYAKCRAAVAYSKQNGKPLLVAGGPWGGRSLRRRLRLPAHINGDVSVDINPNAIAGHPHGVLANVAHLPFIDKAFGAAFASHLLEHLPDTAAAQQALTELERVSEGVYIAYPSRQSLAAWFIRDHHLWVWQKEQTTYFKQRGRAPVSKARQVI